MEYFDICTEEGLPTGRIISRKEAHEKGICHRTAHIWVVRVKNNKLEVLLQKRSYQKDSFPGRLDTSSAGHIQAGDQPLESAIRELGEELGIRAREEDLVYIGSFHVKYEKEFHGKIFRDNEAANVFVYDKTVDIGDLTIQKEELESVGWYDFRDTYRNCLSHNPDYCCPLKSLELLQKHFSSYA